ncbi:hypothetical protein SeLEV6574_g03716 [Synchytrium endobioticum]|uniref:Uncharacterized protein n=1 Tax=Synchytrium endobioticum TaxID=286115 RepID=A0A507D2I3_9FUNG|nr:hypothetical protein SeLEV6574_g03716 [Synchytrium endobioticum]
MLSVLIHKVAADIDTVFSNHIVGMLPLLKERVVEVVGEEGKQAIEEIEAWVDASLEDDSSCPPPPVQVFYKINRLLPAPYRWSIVPHTSFGDGYVTMSEECLFDLLFDIPSFQKTVREVAGVDAKATRAAFMKNSTKGRLLDEVFLLPPEMLAKSRYVLDDSPRRYVRTPSFKTNGLVLSLLWIDTTSKPPPPDRKVEDAINLPNIFKNKTLQSTHQKAWIIAVDSGATCIVGAVAYDPNHPNQRRNLAVTTKCLADPERRYRDWLEGDKPEAICTAEQDTKPYKRKRWHADKGKRGELDRLQEGVVNLVDESTGHKLCDDKKVIVAIGMGDFSTTKSRHVIRDVMAADNMFNIVRGYLEHDERPAYLKPPSKDKNTASKRKEAPNPPGSEESAHIRVDIGSSALPNVAQGTQVEIVFMDLTYSIDVPAPPTVVASQSPLATKNMMYPTSGLDTFTAYAVIKILSDLAKGGRTIIATVHQLSTALPNLRKLSMSNMSNTLNVNDKDVIRRNMKTRLSYLAPPLNLTAMKLKKLELSAHRGFSDFLLAIMRFRMSDPTNRSSSPCYVHVFSSTLNPSSSCKQQATDGLREHHVSISYIAQETHFWLDLLILAPNILSMHQQQVINKMY